MVPGPATSCVFFRIAPQKTKLTAPSSPSLPSPPANPPKERVKPQVFGKDQSGLIATASCLQGGVPYGGELDCSKPAISGRLPIAGFRKHAVFGAPTESQGMKDKPTYGRASALGSYPDAVRLFL